MEDSEGRDGKDEFRRIIELLRGDRDLANACRLIQYHRSIGMERSLEFQGDET